jgi:dUTPase
MKCDKLLPAERECKDCHIKKPIEEYKTKKAYRYRCNDCDKIHNHKVNKMRYERNREKMIKTSLAYYYNNNEEVKKYTKAYYLKRKALSKQQLISIVNDHKNEIQDALKELEEVK